MHTSSRCNQGSLAMPTHACQRSSTPTKATPVCHAGRFTCMCPLFLWLPCYCRPCWHQPWRLPDHIFLSLTTTLAWLLPGEPQTHSSSPSCITSTALAQCPPGRELDYAPPIPAALTEQHPPGRPLDHTQAALEPGHHSQCPCGLQPPS